MNSKFLHPISHSLRDPSNMHDDFPITSIRRNMSRHQRKLLEHDIRTARKHGGGNHMNHRKMTTEQQRHEHRLYDSYIEEKDLTYASSLDQVMSIFHRSSSSNYRAVASRYINKHITNDDLLSCIFHIFSNIPCDVL